VYVDIDQKQARNKLVLRTSAMALCRLSLRAQPFLSIFIPFALVLIRIGEIRG
jgi:hypothetical protein